MDRGVITISETGAVIIPTAPVWMTQFEIADLFGDRWVWGTANTLAI